ncbi:hypothetical protein [Pelagibius sp. Alg239-R121]|uniref:hypothetical protein n=1 Tax=Pelagibius sp. Alg239-R121 TaxID=2993448 RepID=UPI0024A79DC4|nr:hypothetical protein [Pelagibius sp. Alg239-R121]
MRLIAIISATILALTGVTFAQGNGTAIYPDITSSEDYISPLDSNHDQDAGSRAALVAALTDQQLNRGYPPQAALILTGIDSEELAVVSLHRNVLTTQFQARAYINQLAPSLRNLPVVTTSGATLKHNTLDLLKLFGFRRVVVSDGESFSLQINVF